MGKIVRFHCIHSMPPVRSVPLRFNGKIRVTEAVIETQVIGGYAGASHVVTVEHWQRGFVQWVERLGNL